MSLPAVPKPQNPVFTDKVIAELQDILKAKLTWLDHSFGRAQRLAELRDGKKRFYPAVHTGATGYINVFPNQSFGNFSFFTITDPIDIVFNPNNFNHVSTGYALILWFNLDKIFVGEVDRNIDLIKTDILRILTRETFLTSGRITVDKISERYENIYKDFDLDNFRGQSLAEIDSQMLMHPYAGLRVEGTITLKEKC